jgi:ribonuclease T1
MWKKYGGNVETDARSAEERLTCLPVRVSYVSDCDERRLNVTTRTPWQIALVIIVAILLSLGCTARGESAESCESVVKQLNRKLIPGVDEKELVSVLRSLNRERKLPAQFVRKGEARRLGWKPGKDLWSVPELRGKSIGGDNFGNREKSLPDHGRRWREADLGYRGGHRGSKRLIFSDDGLRMVTVDHYKTFTEVPQCQ